MTQDSELERLCEFFWDAPFTDQVIDRAISEIQTLRQQVTTLAHRPTAESVIQFLENRALNTALPGRESIVKELEMIVRELRREEGRVR